MSGWQVGDLALCIRSRSANKRFGALEGHAEPVKGGVYKVDAVVPHPFLGDIGLRLEGHYSSHPAGHAWNAKSFRKIKPDTEGANEDDAAWLKDLLTKKVKA